MADVFLRILVGISLGLLFWGLMRVERIYQYPFFMGSMFLSFLLPQAFSLVRNPGALSQNALDRVLFMACLCAAACWIGYQIPVNRKWLAQLQVKVDDKRLFQVGIALMIQGYFFSFLVSRTPSKGAEGENFSGPVTIYLFFSGVIYIAFAIFLLQLLKTPRFVNLLFTIMAGWIPLQTVLGGRRQPTMTFLVIIGLAFWLILRKVPPRWLSIVALVLMIIVIPVVGQLRSEFWSLVFDGQWDQIFYESQKAFQEQQQGDILELRNAALYIDAVTNSDLYGFGSIWWDQIIFQYVPGQLLGYGFKQSLQFNLLTQETLINLYGYSFPVGTTITGIGDSFTEFGYLGCLTFAVMGYIFKNLWVSAVYQKSIFSGLLYISLLSPAMLSLTHSIGRFLQEAVFQIFFVSLTIYCSRSRKLDILLKGQKL